jgi:hypothetical protein
MPKAKEAALTDQQKRCLRNIADGMSRADAYMDAYPKSKRASARANVARLIAKDNAWQYLEECRQKVEDESVLSRKEKRQFLALVVRTPISELEDSSILVHEREEHHGQNGSRVSVKMMAKDKAIAIDNLMAGHNAPEKVEHSADESLVEMLRSRATQGKQTA